MPVAHFKGGPMDGRTEQIERADAERIVAISEPMTVAVRAEPLAPAHREARYVRRRFYGPEAQRAPLVYDYDGPSAYAVFDPYGDRMSPEFSSPHQAHEWLRFYLRETPPMAWPGGFWPEVRWCFPSPADAT